MALLPPLWQQESVRRADRLFQIIQILRRSTRPVTAATLAAELEVSKRTVYRDMSVLIGQRVPVEGEAGFGYVLAGDYDMPPLMLTPDELEAIMLGAQWVANVPDRVLANAASDVIAKVASAVPENLRDYVATPSSGVRAPADGQVRTVDTAHLRLAIRKNRKLRLRYRAKTGEHTERTVLPVVIGYAEFACLLIGWCELRDGFRHFRLERIAEATILEEPTGYPPGELRRRWERWRDQQLALTRPTSEEISAS